MFALRRMIVPACCFSPKRRVELKLRQLASGAIACLLPPCTSPLFLEVSYAEISGRSCLHRRGSKGPYEGRWISAPRCSSEDGGESGRAARGVLLHVR